MISTPHPQAAVAHLTCEHGRFAVAAHDGAITHLLLPNADAPPPRDGAVDSDTSLAAEAVRQLSEYLAGGRDRFDLPYNPAGTEFQRAVWFALRDIDYGRTASYADLARTIGRPHAVRAVGAATGANPIAVFLPCHRVIGANGSLTGYGGGLELKQALLSLESRESRLPLG
jgi:methylated-DNA-[protein]-cysteine S-methyltransferase